MNLKIILEVICLFLLACVKPKKKKSNAEMSYILGLVITSLYFIPFKGYCI